MLVPYPDRYRTVRLSTSALLAGARFLSGPMVTSGGRGHPLAPHLLPLHAHEFNRLALDRLGAQQSTASARNLLLFLAPSFWWQHRAAELLLAVIFVEISLIAYLLIDSRSRKRSRQSLVSRLALEQQISDLSKRLSASSPEQIDNEIQDGLDRARRMLDADRVCWYRQSDTSSTFERVYCACGPNVPLPPALVRDDQLPLVIKVISAGTPFRLAKLRDLPDSAESERRFFEELGIRSIVLIPSNSGPNAKGLLGIASLTNQKDWTWDLISQLSVLGHLIASAIDRNNAQRASHESEQRFRRIFEEASIGMALERPEGHLLDVNPAFCSMTGYAEEELLQLDCNALTHPEDKPGENALFEELISGKRDGYQLEKRFFRKDGTIFWADVSVSLLPEQPGTLPLVIGMVKDITRQKVVEERLKGTKFELQQLTARLIQAQEDERQRISRELHDDIAQRLSLFTSELDALGHELSGLGMAQASENVMDLNRMAADLCRDVHDLSHDLHSSKLQHLGLRAALKDLCEKVSQQTQTAVDFRVDNLTRSLPPEVALCLFRVAQEALNNVLRHSRVKQASVEATQDREMICLKITDSGIGFDPTASAAGIGLTSMRERLRMINGELIVRSAPGKGTQISAEVKLAQAAAAG
jgi:PAS domain S-box-containing protein